MHILDSEFFDKIDEISVDKFILRCIQCCSHFDANFKNGYNTHYSIRLRRTIPQCPICKVAADNYVGDDEKIENGLDNEDEG